MAYGFSRRLKIISGIVLFFFLWTFELSGIAYAIKSDQQTGVKQTSNTKPEKKFGKDIEDIDNILKDTKTDTETKKSKLKAQKPELETDNAEMKKSFSATEKTIQEKSLPPEILERHRKFVKKYEDNYNELQTNLDAIDKAKTTADADAAIEKTKAQLAKVKPPKIHKPLDPNNLPVKSPEEKQVILEEWTPPAKPVIPPDLLKKADLLRQKPILVAASGSLKGLLNSDLRLIAENNVQIAQSSQTQPSIYPKNSPPSEVDLTETSEVQLTSAIRAKAAELKYQPTKIYNWVRSNIEYVPTYGSIQGADMCLQTKQCNDADTASLLIALFRASNIHARYVYGTKQIPIDHFMNWMGGFTDPMTALNFAATAGIPVKGLVSGGKIEAAEITHVWVKAWVDMIPSLGGIHKQGDTWIFLDASLKLYKYTPGVDIKTAVPFDTQSFIDQLKSTATINETESSVTNVNSGLVQQTMQDYQTRVQTYLSQNYPNATVGDILGKKDIIRHEWDHLPIMPMFKDVSVDWVSPTLPDNIKHKVSFSVTSDNIYYDSTPLNITKLLAEVAGKKITLSYAPATSADEAVINSYLPKPHADGSSIQPSELPSSLPAYLIQLKPELRIDGAVVATGGAIGMGEIDDFTITIIPPTLSVQVVNNKVTAGEYNAVTLTVTRISIDQLSAMKTKIETTKASVEAGNFAGLTQDDLVGDLLSLALLSYFTELDTKDLVTAKNMGMTAMRLSSAGRYSMGLSVDWLFGVPLSVTAGGYSMDIGLIRSLAIALDGNKTKKKQFLMVSGMASSALEHAVPEQLFSTPETPTQGISAVKALKIANEQGIPIYKITQSNVGTVLSQLLIDADAKADIANAVNAGKEVTVAKANISLNGWTGCGYIVIDPATGAGAYMISGGLSGGWFPVIIGSECNKTYMERVFNNFELTNVTIPGLLAPPGLSMLIGVPREVAALMGTITLRKWATMLFSGAVMEGVSFTALETGILVGATSLFSTLLTSVAYEVGVLAGSFISAAVLPCEVKQ